VPLLSGIGLKLGFLSAHAVLISGKRPAEAVPPGSAPNERFWKIYSIGAEPLKKRVAEPL